MPAKSLTISSSRSRGGAASRTTKTTTSSTRGAKSRGATSNAAKSSKIFTSKPASPVVKEPVWTVKDDHARTIQCCYRQFAAIKKRQKIIKDKLDYEETMERLEKEAFLQVVKMQQALAEKEREKEDEERRRKIEMTKRRKRMLEAAFDGDDTDIFNILKEVSDLDTKMGVSQVDVIGRALRNRHQLEMVDCEDANGNTPLSEGASGGHAHVIRLLIDSGADINTKGQFGRTPLYRAAFAGHTEACQLLLELGADPRIYADDSQTPLHVATIPVLVELFTNWDISFTDDQLNKLQKAKEVRLEEQRKRHEAELDELDNKLLVAEKDFAAMRQKMHKLRCELEKRINEHDRAAVDGYERLDLTETAIHDAESELELVQVEYDQSRDKLSQLKLQRREKLHEKDDNSHGTEESNRPGITANIRELDDVLFRDVGNRISDSGKWPLMVDPHSQGATFLRYRDTNYVNVLSPAQMEPNRVRLALLGALRFGKPFVLDLMDMDELYFSSCSIRFNEILNGLLDKIVSRDLLKNDL